jgi:hypothetical protein
MTLRALPDLLRDLASELGTLAADAERVQAALSPFLHRAGSAALDAEAVQAIDHLTQHLAGIGGFLATLAEHAPAECRLDTGRAGDAVSLGALVGRLRGGEPLAPPPNGHFELFG